MATICFSGPNLFSFLAYSVGGVWSDLHSCLKCFVNGNHQPLPPEESPYNVSLVMPFPCLKSLSGVFYTYGRKSKYPNTACEVFLICA